MSYSQVVQKKCCNICVCIHIFLCIHSCVYVYARREDAYGQVKQMSKMLTIGDLVKAVWVFFVFFLLLFYKFEIIFKNHELCIKLHNTAF